MIPLYRMDLTEDEVVLITSCITICAAAFSGKKPDPEIVRHTANLGTTVLPGLSNKLDAAWEAFDLPARAPR
jgi:hypothetical protein